MKFTTMTVSVEPASNGTVKVDVSYTLDNPPNEASAPPDVVSLETLTFAAGTKNIDRLNGLRVSAAEVVAWLKARGSTRQEWSPREYLQYRADTAAPGA
jgi:hypothetical protein